MYNLFLMFYSQWKVVQLVSREMCSCDSHNCRKALLTQSVSCLSLFLSVSVGLLVGRKTSLSLLRALMDMNLQFIFPNQRQIRAHGALDMDLDTRSFGLDLNKLNVICIWNSFIWDAPIFRSLSFSVSLGFESPRLGFLSYRRCN